MTKRVLDVGNCAMDHGSLRNLIENQFDARLHQVHDLQGALQALQKESYDLVIVNRLMDRDGSDGMEIIRRIKEDPQSSATPVMLLSNYPEYQQTARAAGALPGFGKRELGEATTLEKLRAVLE